MFLDFQGDEMEAEIVNSLLSKNNYRIPSQVDQDTSNNF